MSQPDIFTRWGVLASGEGGGRIASNYFARSENPGIDNRVLLLNTNRTDITNTIDQYASKLSEEAVQTMRDQAMEFGSLQGVGNYFPGGEQCAEEDMDRIVGRFADEGFDQSDALLYVTTLGGGTGNGSVPYIINELKKSNEWDAVHENTIHVALAAWPYGHEAGQRHFNAVCGLSRLLRWYDGSQNADLVLLAANSRIESIDDGDSAATDGDRFERVNERIITALDLMIGAGRETQGVVDVRDYVTWPSRLNAYHLTPGLATDRPDAYELEFMFDQAAEQTFVPMEPSTSRVVYTVVRAPKHLIDRGDYSESMLEQKLDMWTADNGLNDVVHRMSSLTPVDRPDDKLDVLMLFGGFDLDPLLDTSRQSFEAMMDQATEHGLQSDVGGSDAGFSNERFRQIRQNLDDYLSENGG